MYYVDVWILVRISLKLGPKCTIDKITTLVVKPDQQAIISTNVGFYYLYIYASFDLNELTNHLQHIIEYWSMHICWTIWEVIQEVAFWITHDDNNILFSEKLSALVITWWDTYWNKTNFILIFAWRKRSYLQPNVYFCPKKTNKNYYIIGAYSWHLTTNRCHIKNDYTWVTVEGVCHNFLYINW